MEKPVAKRESFVVELPGLHAQYVKEIVPKIKALEAKGGLISMTEARMYRNFMDARQATGAGE